MKASKEAIELTECSLANWYMKHTTTKQLLQDAYDIDVTQLLDELAQIAEEALDRGNENDIPDLIRKFGEK